MKRISLYVTLLCIALGTSMSVSFATPISTLSSAAPIVGNGAGENAGVLMFDYEVGAPGPNEVSINANTLEFTGTFWSENVGWITFSELGANGARLQATANPDIMAMTGFAWSQNAGWISFNPRGTIDTTTLTNSDVFFVKSTGLFHGFAWSENLGWISMKGVMTDITAPNPAADFKAFSASGSKVFTLIDPSPTVPAGSNYTFTVENWNDSATTINGSATPSFTHDFRQAKQYYLKITDPFGNSSEGNIQVVADVPADTITSPITGFTAGGTASSYTSTFSSSKVADATDVHSMSIHLRDQYGNPVITEPGIKTVNVHVAFNNNVDKDQRDITQGGNLDLGDAIQFPSTTFGGLSYASGAVGTDSNTSGDYSLDISSYAPTKAGYAFTTPNNDISLQKLSYEVTAAVGNSGVGEVAETHKEGIVGTNNLLFSPALYIGSVTNSDNWVIRQGYATNFSATLLTGSTVALANPKVAHILDIDANALMTYQNPSNITGGTKDCDGYNKTIATFSPGSYTITPPSSTACNRPDSSNILMTPTTLNSVVGFSWTPTIIYAAPASSTIKYTSEITYTNGGSDIKYPSYARSTGSATLADNTVVAVTNGVVNQSVKILGMTNARNSIDVLQGNDTNKVGSLTRTDIKNTIHKNVETMTRGGVPPNARYAIYTSNTISDASWPANKDTIIIQGGDLTIDDTITSGASAMRGIIVLKDDAGNGGNIYIKKNVSNIAAVLYADKSIISGNGTTYYSDSQTATGQLFLEGSVISDNTIGGASMTPLKCPYGANACNDVEAKRYDLNFFRFYTGTGAASPGAATGVPSEGFGYPFVIKYDTRLQTAPPPGFSMAQ